MHQSRGGIWEGDIMVADTEEFEKMDASEIHPRRINAKEVLTPQRREYFYIPICRRHSKLVRKRPRIPRTHSKTGTTCREWRFQWRTSRWTRWASTDRIEWWRWSPERLFVDSRWLHLTSWHWTSGSTLCAERRNFPYSTEIHWCGQGYLHKSGCVARETCRWLLECGCESKFIRFLERIHKSSLYWKRNLQRDICGPGRDWQKFEQLPDLRRCGLKYGPKWEKPLTRENSMNGQTRSQNSITHERWEAFISSIWKILNFNKPSKTQGESWKFQWVRQGLGTMKHSQLQETEASGESNKIPKNKACMYRGTHESTRQRLESSLAGKKYI